MKTIHKISSLAAMLLATSPVQAVESILVKAGGASAVAADFQFYDNFVSSSAPVNTVNLGNAANSATGASTTVYPIANSTNSGGTFGAGSNAWNDTTPILQEYRFDFQGSPNTVTIDLTPGLSNFVVGEEITLTVFAVGDNLGQQATITPSYGGVALAEGPKDTNFGTVRLVRTAATPSVQWKFPVEAGMTSISFIWEKQPGTSAALNGFSISSAIPGTGPITSVTMTPETKTILIGTAPEQLTVFGDYSVGPINRTTTTEFTTYSVLPVDIVEVSNVGIVTALDTVGIATVTATVTGPSSSSASDTSTFTVVGADSLAATASATQFYTDGGTGQITVTATKAPTFVNVPINIYPALTYSSSDTDIITVNASGQIAAGPTAGTATITMSFPNGTGPGVTTTLNITNLGAIPVKPITLVHRYSFNNATAPAPEDAVLIDSVGGQNGLVKGTGGTFTGTALSIPGGTQASGAAYGDLPNGIISALPQAATFETWVTVVSTAGQQRIFDFGSNDGGDGNSGFGQTYFILAARTASETSNPSLGYTVNSFFSASDVGANTPLIVSTQTHFVVTYDSQVGLGTIYMDGVQVGQGPFPLGADLNDIIDINNYLGRSQWGGDTRTQASFNEFRIYTGTMTESEVVASFTAGPDAPIGSKYAAWATSKSLTVGVNDAAGFDAENDGIANALEFVLGGNPLASDTSILPTQTLTPTDFIFTFNRADESKSEIGLTFQYGSTLAGWTDVAITEAGGGQVVVNPGTPATNPDIITVTIPRSGTKMFGRLRAVK